MFYFLETEMTTGAFAYPAADTSFNSWNINLVGLAQTGIDYIHASQMMFYQKTSPQNSNRRVKRYFKSTALT